MPVLLEHNWWVLVIALLLGIAIAWAIFAKSRKTRVDTSITPDVLDDGAAPARRNQALIDAPPAASTADIPALVTPVSAAPIPSVAEDAPTPASPATAASAPAPAPVAAHVEPAPVETAPTAGAETGDDLTKIKGLGPKIAQILETLGITRYAQIAAWTDADIDRIDAQLGKFQGRIRRDSWVEQASMLAEGNATGFADRFGKV